MARSETAPDFVIAGAPRCGTTALYSYLSDHPQIFLPMLKEPHYFAPEIGSLRRVRELSHYLELYESAGPDQLRGDGSVWYLQSETAIPELLQHQPDARFVVMLRNPIEFVTSVHQTLLLTGVEEHDDLPTAWSVQDDRSGTDSSTLLQYRKLASFGAQIQQLQDLAGQERVLVHLLEDMRDSPQQVYRSTLEFLDIEDDGRDEFPVVNERIGYRSNALGQVLQNLPGPLAELRLWLQNAADSDTNSPVNKVASNVRSLTRRNWKPAERTEIDVTFKNVVLSELAGDMRLLETILGRDLQHWTT